MVVFTKNLKFSIHQFAWLLAQSCQICQILAIPNHEKYSTRMSYLGKNRFGPVTGGNTSITTIIYLLFSRGSRFKTPLLINQPMGIWDIYDTPTNGFRKGSATEKHQGISPAKGEGFDPPSEGKILEIQGWGPLHEPLCPRKMNQFW